MGFKIINKQVLAPDIKRLDVLAPLIARKIKPGQFVSVSPAEDDEREALSVVEADTQRKTIALIFQEKNETTSKLGAMSINEEIFSILGPLGRPASVINKGNVVVISNGIGTAQILPVARNFKEAGCRVFGIIGAKTKKAIMLEPQMRIACDRIFITTNDGSYENKGKATDKLAELMKKHRLKLIYAIGSVEMLKAVSEIALKKKARCLVHLKPIMVDCMGMCGSCRVKVGGCMQLACIDGPEFDGAKVDFEDYAIRLNAGRERNLWDNHSRPPSPKPNESRTFERFLLGTRKN